MFTRTFVFLCSPEMHTVMDICPSLPDVPDVFSNDAVAPLLFATGHVVESAYVKTEIINAHKKESNFFMFKLFDY